MASARLDQRTKQNPRSSEQKQIPKEASIKTASNNDTGRRRGRGSKRRKNLSKFQCHKFLHRRTNTRRKTKKQALNFIIKRSTIFCVWWTWKQVFHFGSAEISSFTWSWNVFPLSPVKSRIYDRLLQVKLEFLFVQLRSIYFFPLRTLSIEVEREQQSSGWRGEKK